MNFQQYMPETLEYLVIVFKQQFLVFKQHFMYFHTLFHPYVFLQKLLNNNFQFLNTRTKQALPLFPQYMPSLFDIRFLFVGAIKI